MGKKKKLTKAQLRKIKELLLKNRNELNKDLASGLQEIENHEAHHLADLEDMDNVEDKDAVLEMVNNASTNLEQIDKALYRIEQGTYGTCEECGSAIGLERLRALPFATQCVDCKKNSEGARR